MSAAIQYVIGPEVRLVSSAEETAADVYRTLVDHGLERQSATPPQHRFESTGDDEQAFRALAHRFLGPEVRHVEAFPTGAIPIERTTP
jgi:glutamate racemase